LASFFDKIIGYKGVLSYYELLFKTNKENTSSAFGLKPKKYRNKTRKYRKKTRKRKMSKKTKK
jgi:hypothetical protein